GIVARHTTAVKDHVGKSDRRLIGAVVRCGVGADGDPTSIDRGHSGPRARKRDGSPTPYPWMRRWSAYERNKRCLARVMPTWQRRLAPLEPATLAVPCLR